MTLVDLTERLVRLPSHADESAAGDEIVAWLERETDARVWTDEVGNVFAVRGPTDRGPDDAGPGRSLALVGHHDVVPPADSQVGDDGAYRIEERDGRLYGRGTADMKGALAAAMAAFRDAEVAFDDPEIEVPPYLVFASFVGEEVGGEGARYATEAGFRPDRAVVCEGSTNYSGADVTDVAVAHRGRRGHAITARGTAAHASETAGENAIYRAADAISRLRAIDPPAVDVAGETLAGSVTVTEIAGGSAGNVVPDRCTLTVDERTVPGERPSFAAVDAIEGVDRTVESDVPPMRCGDDAFAAAVLEAAAGAQSGEPALVSKPHATDAGWLTAAGTACVVCGPAEPGEAHTADESVSIAVLERCRRLYRALAASWLE